MELHPFLAAIDARDADALAATLAPDVEFHAAVSAAPFRGRKAVHALYQVVFESFEEIERRRVIDDGDLIVLLAGVKVRGRWVEVADVIRLDDQRRVVEVRLLGRPLPALMAFLGGVGAPLARRRSRAAGAAVDAATRGLPALFSWMDRRASRLIQPR